MEKAGLLAGAFGTGPLNAARFIEDACEVCDKMWSESRKSGSVGTVVVWYRRDGRVDTCVLFKIGTLWNFPPLDAMDEVANLNLEGCRLGKAVLVLSGRALGARSLPL